MNKLILNSIEFQIENFNRSTTFYDGVMSSNAQVLLSSTENVGELQTLGLTPITTLQIEKDGEVVYSLENINAHISYINETVDDIVNINFNITFN